MQSSKKKLIALYSFNKEITRGRTYFYNLFEFLSENFNLTIYSNRVQFLQNIGIKANFVHSPEMGKIPIFSHIFYNYNNIKSV